MQVDVSLESRRVIQPDQPNKKCPEQPGGRSLCVYGFFNFNFGVLDVLSILKIMTKFGPRNIISKILGLSESK